MPSSNRPLHTTPQLLIYRAEAAGDRVPLTMPDERLTWGEWARLTPEPAARLRAQGVTKGDLGRYLGDGPRCARVGVAIVAIQWAGDVPAPMMKTRAPLGPAIDALRRLNTSYLIVLAKGIKGGPVATIPIGSLLDSGRRSPLQSPLVRETNSVGIFRAPGATGPTETAVLSHLCLVYVAAMTEDHILEPGAGLEPLNQDEVRQTSAPLRTASRLMNFLVVGLFSACGLVCEERANADTTADTMIRGGTTLWLCVPSIMVLPTDSFDTALSGTRARAASHSAAVPPLAVIPRIVRTLPGNACIKLYSLTETGTGIAGCSVQETRRWPGVTGTPTPSTRIPVIDPSGADVAPAEPGELWLESPMMCEGHFGGRELSKAASLEDGWLRSGDCGFVDEKDLLWVTGRLGDVNVRGGFRMHPLLVEQVLVAFAGPVDAAIISVPHRVLGQDLVTLLVTDRPVRETEVRACCLTQLPGYDVPGTILSLGTLPRNEFGKLDRPRIRDMAVEATGHRPTYGGAA